MNHFDDGVADLPLVLVVVPVLGACVLLALGTHMRRVARDGIAIAVAVGLSGVAALLLAETSHGRVVDWVANWTPVHGRSVGVAFEVDPLGAGLALLVAALVSCALAYSIRYLDSGGGHYHALVLLFLAGMEGFALTGDLFDLYVFLELVAASAYGLTAMQIEDEGALHGGLSFAIINSLGAAFALMGIGVLYAKTGSLQLALLGRELAHRHPGIVVITAFVLVLIGLLVKGGVAPFHFWVADAHAVAPAPIAFLFSAVMDPLAVYAALRVYWSVFSGTIPIGDGRLVFITLGTLTAVVGAVMCCAQRHIKRLLAFSTITHVGLFLAALGLLTPAGTAAAALYILGHAGVKGALFLLAGMLLDRYGTIDELKLFGRARESRALGVLIALGGAALAGLPPFGTALGKSLAEDAGSSAGYFWFPALFVGVSALTGGAVLRVAARVFLGAGSRPPETRGQRAAEEKAPPGRLGERAPGAWIAVAVLLCGAVAVGVLPGFSELAHRAASLFVDRAGYVRAALGARRSARAAGGPGGWSGIGLALDGASVAGACAVAAAACYGRGLLGRVPRLHTAGGRVLRALHRAHSGHIGDYVAWLMAGGALLAALVGLPLH